MSRKGSQGKQGVGLVGEAGHAYDGRRLVYHSDRQALSTARFRRASLLPTVETVSVTG